MSPDNVRIARRESASDAAIVRAAERERTNRIITLDRRFHAYRLPNRGRFAVLPPPAARR